METAKGTDLPDLLEHLGYTVRRLGSRYHTTREMDSLRIKDRRTWKRYSNGTGGDAITFLQEFCGKDFREAVNYLLEFNGGRARDSPIPHPRPAQAKENLVPGALSGGLVNQVGSANLNGGTAGSSVVPGEYPSVSGGSNVTMTQIPGGSPTDIAQGSTTGGYTEVTSDLYYSNGSLGTLKIPAINLTVKVYQGTDSAALKKGAGHFTNTSIWDGNACFAGHNRGVNNHFGKIHTLEAGDTITLTTLLGTRTYSVASVEKVSVNDSSGTAATTDNRVTLYTCVMDQPEYRWKVTAVEG